MRGCSQRTPSVLILDWQTAIGPTWGLQGKQSLGHVNFEQVIARVNGQNDLQRRMRNRSRHGDSVVDAEDEEEEQQQEAQLSMQRRPSTSSLRSFE